jgi:hypothetical protein
MTKLKNISLQFTKFLLTLPKRDLSILLPSFYLIILVFGFFLTILFYVFPSLVACTEYLGREFCTPTGVYLSFMSSIPGYFVLGTVLGEFMNKIPLAISFFFVVGISILVYFFLGLFLQKVKSGELLKKDSASKMVIIVFFVLLSVLILLVI